MTSHSLRLVILIFILQALSAHSEETTLTTAREILTLSEDRAASAIPVSIQGVVTMSQGDWEGQFFVQDETAGIFVNNIGGERPSPGDLVKVTGISHPGGFAPVIGEPQWTTIGTAPLPKAKPVSIERLMTGIEDSQRLEIMGTVRTAQVDEHFLLLQLTSGGFRFKAIVPNDAISNPQSIIGAKLRLRGTAAATFKTGLRQVITVNLFVPSANDVEVEELDSRDPFLKKPIPINKLAQYRPTGEPGERIRVLGTATYQRVGEDLFIRDSTGGLQVTSLQDIVVTPGEVVEAVGFLDYEDFLPVLQDAVIRKTDSPHKLVKPKRVTIEDLRESYFHADLISLKGKIVDISILSSTKTGATTPSEQVTLTIQAPDFVFTASGPAEKNHTKLATLPLGSIVELQGVSLLQVNKDNGAMEALQILLPSADSVLVLQEPPWLTTQRLLIGLALLSSILIIAFAWIVTVSRKNWGLKTALLDKVKAQDALQEAHDLLEERVEERTAQLKFEVDERQQAEVRFKATLAERTRLAQELHDTTEQSLTGIGLQLDTAAKLHETSPEKARHPLEIARTLMAQSHTELRRSIWDLRSRELEQFEFVDALELSAREILQGTDVQLRFQSSGDIRTLSEVVEENLLRISREAINNILKHADASEVSIQLNFSPDTVTLGIADDGQGFDSTKAPGAADGHFGLLGMSERAKRLNGKLYMTSKPNEGTLIKVSIPIESAQEITSS